MLIAITGTPGTGKSTWGKSIAKALKLHHVDLHGHMIQKKNYVRYDRSRKCYILDVDAVQEEVNSLKDKHKDLLVDSLLSHELEKVDLCIVTMCDIKKLRERLSKRGYSKKKIEENVQAEIFEVCKIDAMEKGHKVMVLDTTKRNKVSDVVDEIRGALKSRKKFREYPGHRSHSEEALGILAKTLFGNEDT